MLHRIKKENDENRDKWVGIGGKIQEGESPHECIFREITEETGLIAKRLKYRGLITFVSDIYGTEFMHLFSCDDFDGELSDFCDEGDLEWVPIEKIPELPIWEGDKIFLELLSEESRFFSLKLVYKGDSLVFHKISI